MHVSGHILFLAKTFTDTSVEHQLKYSVLKSHVCAKLVVYFLSVLNREKKKYFLIGVSPQ